jgi:predicted GIY-YIG superfamily endonuclease
MAYRGNIIKSQHNDQIATLPFNCSATNIVYAIYCAKCDQWYIGYTTRSLKERIAIHKSSIKRKDNTAIAKHFNQKGHATHAHLKVTILDTSANIDQLKTKEALWIDKMNLINQGINERDEANFKLHPDTNITARHFKHSKNSYPYFTTVVTKILYNPLSQFKRSAPTRTDASRISLQQS